MHTISSLNDFFQFYSCGDIMGAVSSVLVSPHVEYDKLQQGQNHTIKYWLNYIDALVFGNFSSAWETNRCLQTMVQSQELLDVLRFNELLLATVNKDVEDLRLMVENSPPQVHKILSVILAEKLLQPLSDDIILDEEGIFADFLKKELSFSQNIVTFRKKNNFLGNMQYRPYLPLSYPCNKNIKGCASDKIPIFFMEPYRIDWGKMLRPWKGRSAVFVFYNEYILWHCLQFDEVLESIFDSQHVVLILNRYPNEQLYFQDYVFEGDFEAVMIADLKYQDLLFELLVKRLKTPLKAYWHEDDDTDDLYRLGKKINLEIETARLGKSRFLAIDIIRSGAEWWDKHYGKGKRNIVYDDYFGEVLDSVAKIGLRKPIIKREKYRIAHVAHRLVDRGYAPTQRIKSLLMNYDLDKYEVYLVVTEQNVYRYWEYPCYFSLHEKTEQRGKNIVQELQENGIKVYIDDAKSDFITTAKKLSKYLSDECIDLAVFHDISSVISLMMQMCDVPKRIFYVHGHVPKHCTFDSIIMGFEEEAERYKKYFSDRGIQLVANPVSIKFQEEEHVFNTKKVFGIDSSCKILTTVSHALDIRLSNDMCFSIGKILQRCPEAYYMPIGNVQMPRRLLDIFESYGVADRVIFLGQIMNPRAYLKAMDIYLNEFPVGGGLAVLEAMSMGCPVVAMYDVDGEYKSREGGNYFGPEYSVKTREGYIDLACNLIKNPAMYREWSEHALRRYHERTDLVKYAQKHMDIIDGKINKPVSAGAYC